MATSLMFPNSKMGLANSKMELLVKLLAIIDFVAISMSLGLLALFIYALVIATFSEQTFEQFSLNLIFIVVGLFLIGFGLLHLLLAHRLYTAVKLRYFLNSGVWFTLKAMAVLVWIGIDVHYMLLISNSTDTITRKNFGSKLGFCVAVTVYRLFEIGIVFVFMRHVKQERLLENEQQVMV